MTASYETIGTVEDGNILTAVFHAPPMNLIGPEVVRDLVALLDELSRPNASRVVILTPSAFWPPPTYAPTPRPSSDWSGARVRRRARPSCSSRASRPVVTPSWTPERRCAA